MDAQAIYMYQNNPNDPPSRGSQRPGNGSNDGNNSRWPKRLQAALCSFAPLSLLLCSLWDGISLNSLLQSSNTSTANAMEIPYSTFYQQVENNNVDTLVFQGQDATGTLKSAYYYS